MGTPTPNDMDSQKDEKYIDLIERYVRGQCEEAEREEVQHLKETDEAFARQLRLTALALAAIEAGEQTRQRERLNRLGKELARPLLLRTPFVTAYKIAAGVLLLLALGWLLKNLLPGRHFPQTPEEMLLAVRQEIPDTIPPAAYRSSLSKSAELKEELPKLHAFQEAYKQHHCDSALALLTEMDTVGDELYLYCGMCYLKIRQPDKALSVLDSVRSVALADKKLYYQAAAWLQKGDTDQALELLCRHAHNNLPFRRDTVRAFIRANDQLKPCELP